MSSHAPADSWATTPPAPGDAPASPPPSFSEFPHKPGSQLGSYELLEKLGGGSMGVVYRARHLHLKKEFALKLLSPKLARDEAAALRFRRETEALGRLDDPHLVRASDAGVLDGVPFLVMELLDGGDAQANLTPPADAEAPAPPPNKQLGLMVQPWSFGAPNNEELATKVQYPWVNQVKSVMQASPGVKSWIHVFRYQVYDFSGKPAVSYEGDAAGTKLLAQNNWNPLATFENHVVIEIGGLLYYDPSYGVTYASLADMQDTAIAGFYNILRMQQTKTMLILQRENDNRLYLYQVPYRITGT